MGVDLHLDQEQGRPFSLLSFTVVLEVLAIATGMEKKWRYSKLGKIKQSIHIWRWHDVAHGKTSALQQETESLYKKRGLYTKKNPEAIF